MAATDSKEAWLGLSQVDATGTATISGEHEGAVVQEPILMSSILSCDRTNAKIYYAFALATLSMATPAE
jgi:hypothetical protein